MGKYQGFENIYDITYFWVAVDNNENESLRVGAEGETRGECYANNLKDAKEVANTHGWESSKSHILAQALGIEDIELIKVEVKERINN